MRYFNYAAAALALALAACSGGSDQSIPTIDLSAAINASGPADAAEIFEVKMVLSPEVTDSTLPSAYSTFCGTLNGNYYIASDRTMIFDSEGKCLSSFDRKGNGPGEYGNYAAFCIDRANGGWLAFTGSSPHVYYSYSASGEFLGKGETNGLIFPTPIGNRWIATNSALNYPQFVLYYLNEQLQVVDSVATPLYSKVFVIPGGKSAISPTISTDSDEALVYWNDSIYNVTSGCQPIAAVNLGAYAMPDDFNPMDNFDKLKDYLRANLYFTKHHFLLWASYDNRQMACFYNRTTGEPVAILSGTKEGIPGILFPDGNGGSISLSPCSFATDDSFYFRASDTAMSELTGNEDANPAFFSVRLR